MLALRAQLIFAFHFFFLSLQQPKTDGVSTSVGLILVTAKIKSLIIESLFWYSSKNTIHTSYIRDAVATPIPQEHNLENSPIYFFAVVCVIVQALFTDSIHWVTEPSAFLMLVLLLYLIVAQRTLVNWHH